MLRNKIGKPVQTPANNEQNKTVESKGPNALNSGIKVTGGIGSTGSGIKTSSLIGVKPFVKPSTGVSLPGSSQKLINDSSVKQLTNPTEQKPQNIRPKQIKTQQERLAQLVNKRAAEIRKENQMINKISSQVGSQKKSYFQEYQTTYGHVLNILKKKLKNQTKENSKGVSKQKQTKIQPKILKNYQIVAFKINAWDQKNVLKQYLTDNFKKESYL